eukprot:5034696-Amphidinium_carterae.1
MQILLKPRAFVFGTRDSQHARHTLGCFRYESVMPELMGNPCVNAQPGQAPSGNPGYDGGTDSSLITRAVWHVAQVLHVYMCKAASFYTHIALLVVWSCCARTVTVLTLQTETQ